MSSVHRVDAPQSAGTRAQWQQLPGLLVSRRWRWMTLAVIVLSLLFVRLGMWQVNRLAQRQALNQQAAQRITAPPLPLTGTPINVEANEFRTVVATGTYDLDQEIVLRNRTLNGLPGMDVLTPLRIAGSDARVLVNRGWIPLLDATPDARKRFAVAGTVTVTGIVRKPQAQTGSWSASDVIPPGGRLDAWFRPDINKIAGQMPFPLLPFYIEQQPASDTPTLPQPRASTDYLSQGPHLGYAIQWFSFAVIVLGGYATVVVTRSRSVSSAQ